ncbi:hypothetical protein LEP1GSC109_0150, partial [Leptospira interrogans str. UI 13372]
GFHKIETDGELIFNNSNIKKTKHKNINLIRKRINQRKLESQNQKLSVDYMQEKIAPVE